MTELNHRVRPTMAWHERTVDQQILDALLRIEELIIAAQPTTATVTPAAPEPQQQKPESTRPFLKRKPTR
jgi:hypothetical protein